MLKLSFLCQTEIVESTGVVGQVRGLCAFLESAENGTAALRVRSIAAGMFILHRQRELMTSKSNGLQPPPPEHGSEYTPLPVPPSKLLNSTADSFCRLTLFPDVTPLFDWVNSRNNIRELRYFMQNSVAYLRYF